MADILKYSDDYTSDTISNYGLFLGTPGTGASPSIDTGNNTFDYDAYTTPPQAYPWTTSLGSVEQWVKFTIDNIYAGDAGYLGVCFRHNNIAASDYYGVYIGGSSTNNIYIRQFTGGVLTGKTDMLDTTSDTWSAGDVFAAQITGTSTTDIVIKIWRNPSGTYDQGPEAWGASPLITHTQVAGTQLDTGNYAGLSQLGNGTTTQGIPAVKNLRVGIQSSSPSVSYDYRLVIS